GDGAQGAVVEDHVRRQPGALRLDAAPGAELLEAVVFLAGERGVGGSPKSGALWAIRSPWSPSITAPDFVLLPLRIGDHLGAGAEGFLAVGGDGEATVFVLGVAEEETFLHQSVDDFGERGRRKAFEDAV